MLRRSVVAVSSAALTLSAGVPFSADDKPPIKVGAVSTLTGPGARRSVRRNRDVMPVSLLLESD